MDENREKIRSDSARIKVGIILSIANGPRSAKEIKKFLDLKYDKFQKKSEKASWSIQSIYTYLSLMKKRKWVATISRPLKVDYQFRSANEEVRSKRTKADFWELGAQRDKIEIFASIFKFVWENGNDSIEELMRSRWYYASTHYTDVICESMNNRHLFVRWSNREEFAKDVRNTGWEEYGQFFEEATLKVHNTINEREGKLVFLKRHNKETGKDYVETQPEFRLLRILEDGFNWHRKGILFPLLLGLYFSTSKETFSSLLDNLVLGVPQSAYIFYSIFSDITLMEIMAEDRHKVYKDMLGGNYKGDEIDLKGENSLDLLVYLPQTLFDYIKKKNYSLTNPSGSTRNTVYDYEKENHSSAGIPEYFLDYKFLPAILICNLMGSTEYPDRLTDGDILYAGSIVYLFTAMKLEFKAVESEVKKILMRDKA